MATQPPEITCQVCNGKAKVKGYVSDHETLADLGELFGWDTPPPPYYFIDCPNCGERIQKE